MTVISTIISKQCIALSTDSLLTDLKSRKPRSDGKEPKFILIRPLRAAAAYYGLAELTNGWTTKKWLESKSANPRSLTLEDFATDLQRDLERILSRVRNKVDQNKVDQKGIGIHLVGYEQINEEWIPELFLISNHQDTDYKQLCCLHNRRQTYAYVPDEDEPPPIERHGEPECRRRVQQVLDGGKIFVFNNGDPFMFNRVARPLLEILRKAREKEDLRDKNSIHTYRMIARRPIEIVSMVQRDFFKKNRIRVGGEIHDLAITPSGEFFRDGDRT